MGKERQRGEEEEEKEARWEMLGLERRGKMRETEWRNHSGCRRLWG